MAFKLVVSDPKERKAYQMEIDPRSSSLVGKKIGDVVDGAFAGLAGYKIQITGGSDQQGFPMRKDVDGSARKKIVLAYGPGFHPEIEGQRKRKNIRGNTISLEIAQVNAKIVEYGKESAAKLLGKEKPAEAKGEEKAEKPKAEHSEKPKEHADKPASAEHKERAE